MSNNQGHWICSKCQEYVDRSNVTDAEAHDACNYTVTWIDPSDDEYYDQSRIHPEGEK